MRSVLTFLFIFIGISPLSAAPVPAVNTSNVRHPNLAAGTTVRITEPIYLRDVRDYILDGQNTLIEYAGPAGVPAIIELGSCLNCTVKNFRIVDLSGADAAVLIGNLPNKVGSTGCVIENVMVRYATGEPGPGTAFSVDYSALGGSDANNDLHTFRYCGSNNHSECGAYIKGTQAHRITFERCNFVDYGNRRPYGILTEDNGFFTVLDCSFGSSDIDVWSKGPEARILLDGVNSEHSTQFFKNATNGAPGFIAIKNVRWDGDPVSNKPVVECFGDGPFTFENGFIRGLNGVNPRMRFQHFRGENGKVLYGAVSLIGWWVICHNETPPTGPELIVPQAWNYQQFGGRHLTVKTGTWPRRALSVQRTP